MDDIVKEFKTYWQYKFIGKIGNVYYFETIDKHIVCFNLKYMDDCMAKVKKLGIIKEESK